MLLRESRSSMVIEWLLNDFQLILNENDNHFCTYAIIFTQYNFGFIICLCAAFVNGFFTLADAN